MSISHEKKMPTIEDEDLPADEPIGTLEPVAYFNGAMPTGVTISQNHLLLVGIYNSAISVSIDDKVRSSNQKSVEQELKFVSKIGSSQMQRQIENKVKTTTKKLFKELEENSGVNTLVDSEDINEYIVSVIREKELLMSKRNNNNNKNNNKKEGLR